MRNAVVEEQVQWVLSYIQGRLVDIWKENIMEDLESRSLSYIIVEKFLANLKEKFKEGDDKTMKVAELKKVKQKSRMMEELM